MYSSTTPPIIGALAGEGSASTEPTTFISTINIHIVYDTIHYYSAAIIEASTKGVLLQSLYDTLCLSQTCAADSQITICGETTIDFFWGVGTCCTHLRPKVWIDGTVSIDLYINNEKEMTLDYSQETQDDMQIAEETKRLRSRERKISEVFDKVNKWREIYTQLKGTMPTTRRLSEKAAELVGIPKKSLDDYMHQIKLGKLYNFDFNKNLECMIGELRRFNKREENKQKHHYKKSW